MQFDFMIIQYNLWQHRDLTHGSVCHIVVDDLTCGQLGHRNMVVN